MRIKIVSDGTSAGTKVVDEKTGETVEGVLMISWSVSTEDTGARVLMELLGVPCDIVTEARNIQVQEMTAVPEGMTVEDEGWTWLGREPKAEIPFIPIIPGRAPPPTWKRDPSGSDWAFETNEVKEN
jgi:hypothetical protein